MFTIADTSTISHNILHHKQFNNTLRKIIDEHNKSKISKPYGNIYEKLTQDEIADVKNNTLNSTFIVIFSKIESRTITKMNGTGFVRIQGGITVYDLQSGQSVLQCNKKIKHKFLNANPDKRLALRKLIESYVPCLIQILK